MLMVGTVGLATCCGGSGYIAIGAGRQRDPDGNEDQQHVGGLSTQLHRKNSLMISASAGRLRSIAVPRQRAGLRARSTAAESPARRLRQGQLRLWPRATHDGVLVDTSFDLDIARARGSVVGPVRRG